MLFASLHRIRSARPSLLYISRLTATATFAYLLALVIPAGTSRPVLAPLTALLVIQNLAAKMSPVVAKRQPNYAAWKLVSKLSITDASRLWCDIEPGCPGSQESIAWGMAMIDAVKRGELAISPRDGTRVAGQSASSQEQSNPTWHTQIARDALKSWAKAHGHSPQFLQP